MRGGGSVTPRPLHDRHERADRGGYPLRASKREVDEGLARMGRAFNATPDVMWRWGARHGPAVPLVSGHPAQKVFHFATPLPAGGTRAGVGILVVSRAMDEGLASDDHFTVDRTPVRSHASRKNLKSISRPGSSHRYSRSTCWHTRHCPC